MDISTLIPRDPIEVVTPSGRSVKLKWLTAAGVDSLAHNAAREPDALKFMTIVLHEHLIDPNVTLKELQTWPRNDLDAVGKAWAAHDLGLDRELTGDDVPAAFREAADEYSREQAKQTSRMLGWAFEAIRRQNEVWVRNLVGPSAAIMEAIEGFRRAQEHWQKSLAFTEIARAMQEQQRLASSLSSIRFVEEMQRAAVRSLGTSVLNDLAATSRSLEAALGYRRNLLNAMEIASSRALAARLDRGLESLTRAATAVWQAWGAVEGTGLHRAPPVIHQAPVIEVYAASAAASGIVGEPPSNHPQFVRDRQQQLTASLPDLLVSVDNKLIPMHEGATSLVDSRDTESARHFSVSLRELLTHFIHILAPDEAIHSWPGKVPEDFNQNRPTRRGRLRYILRAVSNTAYEPFVASDMRQVIDLIDALHAGTHSIEPRSDPVTRRLVLRRVEFFLALLVDAHNMARK